MLKYLQLHNTGRDEDLIIIEKFAKFNKEFQDLVYSIASKDLKLGIQSTTINKIWGENFIPVFDVLLAQKYYDDPDKLLPMVLNLF